MAELKQISEVRGDNTLKFDGDDRCFLTGLRLTLSPIAVAARGHDVSSAPERRTLLEDERPRAGADLDVSAGMYTHTPHVLTHVVPFVQAELLAKRADALKAQRLRERAGAKEGRASAGGGGKRRKADE